MVQKFPINKCLMIYYLNIQAKCSMQKVCYRPFFIYLKLFLKNCSCMLMSHLEEPKVTEDEEPPTEQDKRKKMVSYKSSF